MLLGIDVGGTFTDAALVAGTTVKAFAKRPTTHGDIVKGLLSSAGEVLRGIDPRSIERAAISTTLLTNRAATGRLPDTDIYVIPGPGLDCRGCFPVSPTVLAGYTDHRGQIREQAALDLPRVFPGRPAVASGKFSTRNPEHELALSAKLKEQGAGKVVTGHGASGRTGFIRRTNSAYFTAATFSLFEEFFSLVSRGLKELAVTAPLYVLKADGSAMPAEWMKEHTVEAYFTGPAASAVGIKALNAPRVKAASLDVGGTTTDIALWEHSSPLFAKRGARINGYPTAVRALQLRSVAIGGDSWVRIENGQIKVGPERRGPAMALGGPFPTLTDAFLYLKSDDFGDPDKARAAMASLGAPEVIAKEAVNEAIKRLAGAIEDMIEENSLEPVYRVGDVTGALRFKPKLLIGAGGAARGLIPALGRRLNLPADILKEALVANAVGAALAEPAIEASFWADTARGYAILPEAARRFSVDGDFSIARGEALVDEWLKEEARRLQIPFSAARSLWREEIPVVRDGFLAGSIISLSRSAGGWR